MCVCVSRALPEEVHGQMTQHSPGVPPCIAPGPKLGFLPQNTVKGARNLLVPDRRLDPGIPPARLGYHAGEQSLLKYHPRRGVIFVSNAPIERLD